MKPPRESRTVVFLNAPLAPGASVCFSYAAVAVVTVRRGVKESGRGGARKADFSLVCFIKNRKKTKQMRKRKRKTKLFSEKSKVFLR